MKKALSHPGPGQGDCQNMPNPFHIYDERGIRENARALKAAFAWNRGFKEYFAVKATPTPGILKILREEGCGVDCFLPHRADDGGKVRVWGGGDHVLFQRDPASEFELAGRLGAYINLDDLTHVDFLYKTLGRAPGAVCCRFNPGGVFTLGESKEGFQVMDNPGQAKYGMTRSQLPRRLPSCGNWNKTVRHPRLFGIQHHFQ